MFILCIIFPPIPALIYGGILSCFFNIILCLLGWIPGAIHAFMVVNNAKAEERNKEQIEAIQEQTKSLKEPEKKTDEAG